MSLAGSAVLGDPGGARANQGESEPRISAVEILLDDLLDHRLEEPYSSSKRLSYSARKRPK